MPYFYDLIKQIEKVEGCIVECGVGWGKSLAMIAISLKMNNDENRNIYIYGFDSFKGFPKPDKVDLFGKARKGHYSTSYKYTREFLDNFLEDQKKIELVKGYVENTLPGFKEKIAFLHIDVDIYNAYRSH